MHVLLACTMLGLSPAEPPAREPAAEVPSPPGLLLVDTDHVPHLRLSWVTAGGETVTLERDQQYASPGAREPLGGNLESFVALGGKRLAKGAGHPKGAIVRVGFYKIDNARPLFEGIDPSSSVSIRLENVVFNQPAVANHASPLHHFMFDHEQLMRRGLPMKAMDVFNLRSPTDTLNDRVTHGTNARPGVLDGSERSDGLVTITKQDDGSFTLDARIPYQLFRHIKNAERPGDDAMAHGDTDGDSSSPPARMRGMDHAPSEAADDERDAQIGPGGFLEPFHFHVEFEAVPARYEEDLEHWPPEPPTRPAAEDPSARN